LKLDIWEGLDLPTRLKYTKSISGLSAGFDNNFLLMNMRLWERKIFKNQRGEISLNVYGPFGTKCQRPKKCDDILIEDTETNVSADIHVELLLLI